MRTRLGSTHLLQHVGGLHFRRELNLARRALGKREDALLSTAGNGTVKLGVLETVHLDFVRLFGELQNRLFSTNHRSVGTKPHTFLIVALDTPERA